MTIHPTIDRPVLRKQPAPRTSIYHKLLAGTAASSSVLLGLGLVELFDPRTVPEWAKVATFVVGGGLVSYGVNRLAIKSAADLAVKGLKATGVAAVAGMAFVGLSLATTTYAGLTLDQAEGLRLEQHGTVLAQRVGESARATSPAAQAVPVMRGIATDLAAKAECEPNSCVSGRTNGGRGPTTRVLVLAKERAEAVASQVELALDAGRDRANLAGPLLTRYDTMLAEPGPARAKRGALQQIDSQVRDALAGRIAGDPAAVLAAYAAELDKPVAIPGQPDAARTVSGIFQTHAGNLKRALAAPGVKEASLPMFPGRTGVSDTLAYVGHFWPVAAIALVLDCVFPLLFWICVFSTKWWHDYQQDPTRKPPSQDDELDLSGRPAPPRPVIHPAFDPEAYFPSLTPRNRSRTDHEDMRGPDAR